MKLRFEWDERKAKANLQRHGVNFALATSAFQDPFAIELLDNRQDYGEPRLILIGMAEGPLLLFVAFTEREDHIRIISARRATKYEEEEYFRQNS
jgi:uncharacterized DUF497 family protein